MTCTCKKDVPAKIDWTKPIQWNPWGHNNEYSDRWDDAKLIGRSSKTNLPVVETIKGGLYTVTEEGMFPQYSGKTVYVRNKPTEIVRGCPTVEVYRTESGSFYSRIFAPANKPLCPDTWKLVGKASVPVAWEA